jgi:hypothetical protein
MLVAERILGEVGRFLKRHPTCEVTGCNREARFVERRAGDREGRGGRMFARCEFHRHGLGSAAAARSERSEPAARSERRLVDAYCGPDHLGRYRVG